MITIFTALYPEAKELIRALSLKKDMTQNHFQVFSDENNQIQIVITGASAIAAATGDWLPPGVRSHGGAPPILFLVAPKRECAAPGGREKALRRVGLRQRRPPAAGGGWLALPCRSQGRKRTALGESLGPGRFRDTPASLSAAAHASAENQPARSDAERAKREAGQMRSCTPTTSAPSATGRQLGEPQKT